MKRHPAMRDLSSDHHQALVQAHRLQRASKAGEAECQTAIAGFLQFWRADGQRHFCEEEQALLPFFARWGELDQAPINQMLREHALIRRDAQLLSEGETSAEICQRLGAQLEAHVRLEERVVFPLIEAALPEEALNVLTARLQAWHEEANMTQNLKEAAGENVLPGENLQTHKMPGHWLLARLGKKVLRPGGLELTRQMLDALDVQTNDVVVEFAPGLGATTQLTLEKNPAAYIGVERDKDAAKNLAKKFDGPNREFITGSADATGLPDASASVVYGEAMLTMQTPADKASIVGEAARLLKPGGRYGIHELCLVPDDLDESLEQEICQALGGSIHVGARPLRVSEWRALLKDAGLTVREEFFAPMALLEPQRLLADEGAEGAFRFAWNALNDEEALKRLRSMRATFRKYKDHLSAVALVSVKE